MTHKSRFDLLTMPDPGLEKRLVKPMVKPYFSLTHNHGKDSLCKWRRRQLPSEMQMAILSASCDERAIASPAL